MNPDEQEPEDGSIEDFDRRLHKARVEYDRKAMANEGPIIDPDDI